jgi:CSLREA domain-containing protein
VLPLSEYQFNLFHLEKRITLFQLLYFFISSILLLSSTLILDTVAFKDHTTVIADGLSFLKPEIFNTMRTESMRVDFTLATQIDSSYHFDDCNFEGSSDRIISTYNRIIDLLDPSDPLLESNHNDAAREYGRMLHIIQDFYSHSNWVEQGIPGLLDGKRSKWTQLLPFQMDRDGRVIIIQGEQRDIPEGWVVTPDPNNKKKINVLTPEGVKPGLISGTTPPVVYGADQCPDNISIGHWNALYRDTDNTGLNKDSPERDGYLSALSLASSQTTNEWCRLVNIINENYGRIGIDNLLRFWVSDSERVRAITPTCTGVPVANAGPDQSKNENTLVFLDGSLSNDPDKDSITYSWTQIEGPPVQLRDKNSVKPFFIAPQIDATTNLRFQLIVHDGFIESEPDTVTISILDTGSAGGTTLTVNSDNDEVDQTGCDDNHCSLREAINAANGSPGTNTIIFNIPTSGQHSIKPSTPLPALTESTIIDATTQPTQQPIELDGSLTTDSNGLTITGGNSIIRGMVINQFDLHGIRITGQGNNRIEGSSIGTEITGSISKPNGGGIAIIDSPNNIIGGNTPETRNIISGNNLDGIVIANPGSSFNRVEGNFIGTDVSGKMALGNGRMGVLVSHLEGTDVGATRNVIGGIEETVGGIGCSGVCNIISGNRVDGINIFEANDNIVAGNLVGIDVEGSNTLSNGGSGINIGNSHDNIVGGSVEQARNVISGNVLQGIELVSDSMGQETYKNSIVGNFIGTNIEGTQSIGNTAGIVIVSINGGKTYDNLVGGTNGKSSGVACSGKCNLISGNREDGLIIQGPGSANNKIMGNLIGTTFNGIEGLGNGNSGVFIDSTPNNFIGGTIPGSLNVISGNTVDGIVLAGLDSRENNIQGNLIGTDHGGSRALGNGRSGVLLIDSPNNFIGNTTEASRNVISANNFGIVLAGPQSVRNHVLGNRIGTNIDGTNELGNIGDGIVLTSTTAGGGANSNIIGLSSDTESRAKCVGGCNLISGNVGNGISIKNGPANNLVMGNNIGTNADGTGRLGNMANGILIDQSSNNRIGGIDIGDQNIISGNGGNGVTLSSSGSVGNSFVGNNINHNNGLGIDLNNDGVTTNDGDANDADTGPNSLMNFPEGFAYFNTIHDETVIKGSLSTLSPETARIDLYSNIAMDPSGFGEGEYYLGQVRPDSSGLFIYRIKGNLFSLPNPVISGTATDAWGSTSEFSNVFGSSNPPIADAGQNQIVRPGQSVSLNGDGSIDSDGTIVTYGWEQTAGSNVELSSANTVMTRFNAPIVSVETILTFKLTVTDNDGAADEDTVVIIVTPETVDIDNDNDGILNLVDKEPIVFSNNFGDTFLEGSTSGEIVDRNGVTLIIADSDDGDKGTTITAEASTMESNTANLDVCGGTGNLQFELGDEATITCSDKLDLEVELGEIKGTLYTIGGTQINVIMQRSNGLTFDYFNAVMTALNSNLGVVRISVDGAEEVELNAGESINLNR